MPPALSHLNKNNQASVGTHESSHQHWQAMWLVLMSHLTSINTPSNWYMYTSHWPALMTHQISTHMYVPSDQQDWVTGQHWPPQMSHDSGQSSLINYLAIHWWDIWPAVIIYLTSTYLQKTSAITAKQHYICSYKPCVAWNIFLTTCYTLVQERLAHLVL